MLNAHIHVHARMLSPCAPASRGQILRCTSSCRPLWLRHLRKGCDELQKEQHSHWCSRREGYGRSRDGVGCSRCVFLLLNLSFVILRLFVCRDPFLCADRRVCHSFLSFWVPSTVGPTASGLPGLGFLHLHPTRGEERPQHTVDSKPHIQS